MGNGLINEDYGDRPVVASRDVIRELAQGPDATLNVGRWVRILAKGEACEAGEFAGALAERSEGCWPGFMRDLFGSLYGLGVEPVETPDPAVAWAGKVLEAAAELPEWRRLCEAAEGDPWRCGLGAANVAHELKSAIDEALSKQKELEQAQAEQVKADAKASAQRKRVQRAGGDPEQDPKCQKLAQAATEAEAAVADAAQAMADAVDVGAVEHAVQKGSEKANGEILQLQLAATALGCGEGAGVLSAVKAPEAALQSALRKNAKLRRIAMLAGRLRMSAMRVQRAKAAESREELHDVGLGSELARLLPSETMLLAMEETELVLLRKLAEGEAMQYELRGKERVERGPLVVLVDSSGSMNGARNEWAMGVALALLEVAARQRRAFELVHFDYTVQHSWYEPNPRAVTMDKLVAGVSYFSGGGTNIDTALAHAEKRIAAAGALKKADVVLVSDGMDSSPYPARIKAMQDKLGARTYAIGIAVNASMFPKECAGVAVLSNVDLTADTSKVDLIFGLGA